MKLVKKKHEKNHKATGENLTFKTKKSIWEATHGYVWELFGCSFLHYMPDE